MNLRRSFHGTAPLALLLALSALQTGCASSREPVYAGTASGRGTGIAAPGQQVIVSNPQYQQGSFGTPSAIPDPIRVPQAGAPVMFDTSGNSFDDQGRRSMAEADPDRAEFNFERALEVNPFDPVALNNLAVAKAERGQFHEAMGLLERAAKLAPDNAEVVANLARLRGYVQSYATAGAEPGAAPKMLSGPLPPEPPPLWSSYSEVATPVAGYRVLPQTPPPGDYYTSEACRRQPVKGKKGKTEIVCEPASP